MTHTAFARLRAGIREYIFSTFAARTVEASAALGTVGDIVLADLSQYIAITKGGVKADESMHFYFDQNIRTFRFVMRLGGQPWLSTPITRKNGSSTQSHFVTLATRG